MSKRYRAYKTEYQGVQSIVFAASAGSARCVTARAAKKAEYAAVRHKEIYVTRAPAYDAMRMSDGSPADMLSCYIADYLHANDA